MNWGAIIIFCVIVALGESKKVYEAKIIQYSCPTHCLADHKHIQPFIQRSEDSLRVAGK
jgi:hypothetical protein